MRSFSILRADVIFSDLTLSTESQHTHSVSEFVLHNAQSEVNPHAFWEVTKCHIRGACTSFSSHLNKTHREEIEKTVCAIALLESQQKSYYTGRKGGPLTRLHIGVLFLHRPNSFI